MPVTTVKDINIIAAAADNTIIALAGHKDIVHACSNQNIVTNRPCIVCLSEKLALIDNRAIVKNQLAYAIINSIVVQRNLIACALIQITCKTQDKVRLAWQLAGNS